MKHENSERKSPAVLRAERLAKLEFLALLDAYNRAQRKERKRHRAKPDFYSHYLKPVRRLKARNSTATERPHVEKSFFNSVLKGRN